MDTASLTAQIASTLMAEPASSPDTAAPTSTESTGSVESTQSAPTGDTASTPPVDAAAVPASGDEDEFAFPDEAAQQATPAQATPDKPVDEPSAEGQLPKEVQEAFLKTERGKKLYQGFKLGQELRKPAEQGGIGMLPTVDQIKEFHQDSQDLKLMAHEFHHGDPSYAQNWVKQWFQPGPQGYSQGAMQVARSFVPTIAEMANSNPQAAAIYQEIAKPAVMNYVEEWYRRAEAEQDPQERITAFNVARLMENDVTGKFRPISEEMLKPEYRSPNTPDPQRAEIDGKLRFINQFEQRRTQEAQQQFHGAMEKAIYDNVSADVQHALKELKSAYPGSTYAALERQFAQEVYATVNNNPAQLRNFVIARDMARSARTPEAIKAAADAWRSVARPVVRQLRTRYMAENGQKVVDRSAERHATLDEASQKRGTTGVAQSTGKNLSSGPTARQAGESYEDYLNRVTSAALSA